MVARNIFNLANVNTVPCILETINSAKRTNYHLNKFLSTSALSSLSSLIISEESTCLLTSLLMYCYSHLHGKRFPSILSKTTYFHMHIYISEFFIPLCYRYQVGLSFTYKEYCKDMQFLATAPYYNPTTSPIVNL